MANVRITFEEVRQVAGRIRTHNENLYNTLETIKNEINKLEADYTSDTSDTIRSKINGMEPKFITYKEVIESYAKFLDNAANQWEQNVAASNANANQFI